MRRQYIDLTGQVFGRLTVIERAGARNKQPAWNCRCECGEAVTIAGSSLRNGDTKSCGCFNKDALRISKRTHGMTETREYGIWCKMRERCSKTYNEDYAKYGGRGIVVCDRWRDSFAAFYEDMGPRPSSHHTIDRRDNDGPYSPENCRWATRVEQNRNRRNTVRYTMGERRMTLPEWAAMLGFPHWKVLHTRLRRGWSIERTLTTPV